MSKSREIIEIIADVVKETAVDCTLTVVMPRGVVKEIPCPPIHYVFGNAQYVKDKLDDLSKSPRGAEMKFPMIALFCPFNEQRNTPDYHSKAKVRILIACSSDKKWSNEQRLETSFKNIFDRFITDSLKPSKKMADLILAMMSMSHMNTLKTTLMADMGRTRAPGKK